VEAAYNLGAKIVTLCNTMDANARAIVSKEFSIPIIGPIEPAVKATVGFGKAMSIGVIATKATIESSAYVREIKNHDPAAKVFSVVAPLLATMADMDEFGKMKSKLTNQETEAILEANLRSLMKKDIDILILGCTHYSVFEQVIHDVWKRCTGKEIHIVDSSKELSLYTLTYLEQNKLLSFRVKHKGLIFRMASREDTRKHEQGILRITGHTAKVMPMDIGEVVGRLSEKDRLFQKAVVRESKEDVNLRGVIISSSLSAGAKVAIADKLYGAGIMDISKPNGEILPLELQEEYIIELDKLAVQDEELSKILLHIKDAVMTKKQG
jgi:glutamate racemase